MLSRPALSMVRREKNYPRSKYVPYRTVGELVAIFPTICKNDDTNCKNDRDPYKDKTEAEEVEREARAIVDDAQLNRPLRPERVDPDLRFREVHRVLDQVA